MISSRLAISMLVMVGIDVAFLRHADAQIVNVQGQLAKAPETDGASGQLEAKIDWREGNSPSFLIGGAGALMYRHGRFLGLALARGEYETSRGLTLTEKSFEHLRARITIDCRWRWEVFVQHEYDRFRRLSVRAVAGTGPALQLVNEKPIAVLAGAAYMVEYERNDERDGVTDSGFRDVNQRGSFYVTGVEKIGEHVSIAQTLYMQPRLDDFSDYRVLGELSVTTTITKRFALVDGFTIAYDRTPADGVERLDTQLKIGLLMAF